MSEPTWGPTLDESAGTYRPWLIVSTGVHPFDSEEAIVLATTTQRRPEAIPAPEEAWIAGGSDTDAFVSPWDPTTMTYRDFDNTQGTISNSLVTRSERKPIPSGVGPSDSTP